MLSVNELEIRFSGNLLFSDVSFLVKPKDRIGLTGKNGTGKSSLMKCILGDIKPDGGEIGMPSDIKIAYLPQHIKFNEANISIMDEVRHAFPEVLSLENKITQLSKELAERTDYESDEYATISEQLAEATERAGFLDADSINADIEKTLKGLGFNDNEFARETSELSGGWRMRVELAKLLLSAPDLLMLDEPTNHLDIESIQWLEAFLQSYKGAVMLISHDRRFLDTITMRTLELEQGKLYDYPVPYSEYVKMREERIRMQVAEKKNQKKQIKETRDFIDKFRYKASKAKQVQSRIKQLEKTQEVKVDDTDISSIGFTFPPAPRAGKIVTELTSVTKSYGRLQVLKDISLVIERGEKIAFVGKNGEGKTTLARLILGMIEYNSGTLKPGYNVRAGYYAQNQEELMDQSKTVFETLDDMATGEIRKQLRSILGSFMFSGEDIDKKVSVLSGGEKARLALASLILEPYNLLVMDEPTNHLDIPSKEVLKKALKAYDGTLVLISHDRYFLDGLVNTVYEVKNKTLRQHLGGIEHFLRRRRLENIAELDTSNKTESATKSSGISDNKARYLRQKKEEKARRKTSRKIEETEKHIEQTEKKLSDIEDILSNPEQLNHEHIREYNQLKKQHEHLMNTWEQLLNKI